MFTLGILKETKVAERRVALVPASVQRLVEAGARVLIESGAGSGAGFSDDKYRGVGADIRPTPEAVIAGSDAVIKVKEPVLSEIRSLRAGQLFMSFLHLAAFPD